MKAKSFVDARIARLTFAIIFVASALFVSTASRADKGEPINIGTRHRIDSKILGETRFYLVHKPPHYDLRKDSFPVLYLLDGDINFAHTSAAAELLAENLRIPELLIVGVSNTDRMRDLLPPASAGAPTLGVKPGADKFLAFLAEELIPTIERDYRTRPYRILIGHSLGGLFAVYSLENKPELFNAYISISPSLFWDNQSLAKSAGAFLDAHKSLMGDFYMTMANEGDAMLGGAWKLSAAFEENKPHEFRWQFHRHPEEMHGTIPYQSTYDGLQAIFDGWYISDPFAFYGQAGLGGLEKHFAEVSKRVGYTVPIPGYVLDITSDALERNGRSAEIEPVINKGLELYPDNFYAHYGAGRFYVAQNDRTPAIEHLTKALLVFPGNDEVRTELEKLNVNVSEIIPEKELTPKQMQAIAGEYKMREGIAIISIVAGKLFAQASDGDRCELRAMSDTKLFCVGVDAELTLQTQGSKIKGYTIDYPTYSEYHAKVH